MKVKFKKVNDPNLNAVKYKFEDSVTIQADEEMILQLDGNELIEVEIKKKSSHNEPHAVTNSVTENEQ